MGVDIDVDIDIHRYRYIAACINWGSLTRGFRAPLKGFWG